VLNEILADPKGTDTNKDGIADPYADEFIEILNLETHPVALAGVAVLVGANIRYVFPTQCLPPLSSITLFGGDANHEEWKYGRAVSSSKRLSLTNQGALVRLLSASGIVLDSHQYHADPSGPQSVSRNPDGLGSWGPHPLGLANSPGRCVNGAAFPTCELPPVTDHDDYRLDKLYDCELLQPGELIINEIMPDPGLADTNGDGLLHSATDEFVELILSSNSKRRVGRSSLYVNGEKRFQFPDKCLEPGTVILVFGGESPHIELATPSLVLGSPKPLRLSNTGGQISIHIEDILDTDYIWSTEGNRDQSLTRFPDLTGPWVLHESVSAFSASPGHCVDGTEITTQGCSQSP
jgi:hypothetical protein